MYLGLPDVIAYDAGKSLYGKAFCQKCRSTSTATKSVPVKSANSMTVVERYPAPVRKSFHSIVNKNPDTNDVDSLQMAVKAIIDSVGSSELIPTLLVFGALPRLRLRTDKPTPSTYQRSFALCKATEAMKKNLLRPAR